MADIPVADQVRPAIARSLLRSVFLAVGTHILLVEVSDEICMQIAVSVVGITLLTAVAYHRSWSKKAEKPRSPCLPAPGIGRDDRTSEGALQLRDQPQVRSDIMKAFHLQDCAGALQQSDG